MDAGLGLRRRLLQLDPVKPRGCQQERRQGVRIPGRGEQTSLHRVRLSELVQSAAMQRRELLVAERRALDDHDLPVDVDLEERGTNTPLDLKVPRMPAEPRQ